MLCYIAALGQLLFVTHYCLVQPIGIGLIGRSLLQHFAQQVGSFNEAGFGTVELPSSYCLRRCRRRHEGQPILFLPDTMPNSRQLRLGIASGVDLIISCCDDGWWW